MVPRWTSRSFTRSSFVPTTTIGIPFIGGSSTPSHSVWESGIAHCISTFDTVDLFSEVVDFPQARFLSQTGKDIELGYKVLV
jgi:hypothetical protein